MPLLEQKAVPPVAQWPVGQTAERPNLRYLRTLRGSWRMLVGFGRDVMVCLRPRHLGLCSISPPNWCVAEIFGEAVAAGESPEDRSQPGHWEGDLVRHEAPQYRAELTDHRRLLSQQHDDNAGTDQHHRMIRVRQARQEGVREEPALTLLKSPASSNPVDLGWYAVRTNMIWRWELRGRVKVARFGGHGEGLRRSRGDIAGV